MTDNARRLAPGGAPTEASRLDGIASDSWYARGANAAMIEYSARVLARFWRGTRCLELGPAEGMMTPVLAAAFPRLTCVEGAESFCDQLRERFPDVDVVHSLFESFEPDDLFDTIILGHVLEHVGEPVELLRRASTWLSDGGRILVVVPNARSLHRQAAVEMGLLAHEHALNEADVHHGHRRVYDPEMLREHVRAAGLRVAHYGGYWLKPVSNTQIERDWTPEMLEAFMRLGERYPDVAGDIYVVAEAR